MSPSWKIQLVEDFEPFRRFVRSELQQRPEFQIIGEASDGEDAVWKAEKLRPDLILLDISLPRVSGLEAARRIRKLAPDSKILFLSMESSFSVVQECFRLGGLGYVQKLSARTDLLPAIDAVLRGIRFVSRGLEFFDGEAEVIPHRHELLFCSDEAVFLDGLSRFVASAIDATNAVIVLVTKAHRQDLERLLLQGLDVGTAIQQRTYVPWDVHEALSTFLVDDWPDATRLSRAMGDLFKRVGKGASGEPRRIVACGECAPILWAQGELEAAIQLEQLWDGVMRSSGVDTLCVYPVLRRPENDQAIKSLCGKHTTVNSR
jgi:DNA-binding response OmpR family regulator